MSKQYRYSLAREDKKVAGVCAAAGKRFGVDPTFLRIAFIFTFLVIEWELAVGAYIAAGLALTFMRAKELGAGNTTARSIEHKAPRGSVHDLRTKLDDRDRRMMAIDHHLSSHDSDKLAREIEELRAKVDAKKAEAGKDAAAASEGDA
ncbi:PspC domain-containing protein [Sphingomicrobium arenosum]|uniref:PspC domain-containing protein n=1 Tax=Sphingomicrobium arenosum TaxID=2233861 RepID=UPI00223FD965|nr:PspC domain-containing protein [Sphingomicrobium arenosum]